ncbi:hypothetical protein [Bacillus sp. 03113]|uniref:hypothetical protein n=1 Tax=Bacillus sp. 03113 TaxID=2578211 RepID=UPI001141E846|nr:hypothetical protein [Bacillus sp. 03113]
MNRFFKLIIGLFFVFSLTGCIGEDYDFSPPTVSLLNPNDINQQEDLEEANINWNSDKQYSKETEDILSLAKKQNKMYFDSRQQVDLLFEHGDFDLKGVSVSVHQNDKKIDLEFKDDQSFNLPNEKGEYVIVVDLNTDSGNAQYVGNIVIQ